MIDTVALSNTTFSMSLKHSSVNTWLIREKKTQQHNYLAQRPRESHQKKPIAFCPEQPTARNSRADADLVSLEQRIQCLRSHFEASQDSKIQVFKWKIRHGQRRALLVRAADEQRVAALKAELARTNHRMKRSTVRKNIVLRNSRHIVDWLQSDLADTPEDREELECECEWQIYVTMDQMTRLRRELSEKMKLVRTVRQGLKNAGRNENAARCIECLESLNMTSMEASDEFCATAESTTEAIVQQHCAPKV